MNGSELVTRLRFEFSENGIRWFLRELESFCARKEDDFRSNTFLFVRSPNTSTIEFLDDVDPDFAVEFSEAELQCMTKRILAAPSKYGLAET